MPPVLLTTRGLGVAAGVGARGSWVLGTDRTNRDDDDDAGKQWCQCRCLSPFSSFRSRVLWSRATKTSAIGALSLTPVFFFPVTGCPLSRHRRSLERQACASNSCGKRPSISTCFYPRSRTRDLQPFFDFNAIYILNE